MCFPAQWALIDELDFMKQEIPRWNEVLRRETEARRAVSCRQTGKQDQDTPCIRAHTHAWSHARMHAHSEVLEERWSDGYRKRGPRGGTRVCMNVAHSNSNTHMHENTRTVRSTVSAASRSRTPEEPANHGTAVSTREGR